MTKAFSTSDLIAEIRSYQEEHSELLKSHHFAFDCPLDRSNLARPDFIWFGVNPGTDEEDWRQLPSNTEETRDLDFQTEFGRTRTYRHDWRWRTRCGNCSLWIARPSRAWPRCGVPG